MLEQFPRPPGDTGRGVHWSNSPYLWGQDKWPFWKEQIQAMNLKWVKLLDDGSGSAFGLIQRLIDIGVMPVVRMFREEPNPGRFINIDYVKRCVEHGAVYFETNNEPDLDLEWEGRRRPTNWLDIVVDNFIIEASQIRDVGGYLLFPAFGPGGRGNPFQMIVERGRRDLLDGNCCLAIHNYCLGRPLDYPNDSINTHGVPLTQDEWEDAGGMWAWEMGKDTVNFHRQKHKNPKASVMQDSTCFRAFEYFDALVNEAVGHSIPIFTTEGGYNVGQRGGTTFGDDARYPKPTPERASQFTDAMFQYIAEKGPPYYFACMPWIVGVSYFGHGAMNFEAQGPWFTNHYDRGWGLNGELPIVQRLKDRQDEPRVNGPVPAAWQRYADGPEMVGRDFDDRFKYLEPQVELLPVENLDRPHWRLSEARWRSDKEGGIARVFVRVLDQFGQPVGGVQFRATHGDDADYAKTKAEGYGDIMMTAGLGTYTVDVFDKKTGIPSDALVNVGNGTEIGYAGTSFFLTFVLSSGGPSMFDFKKWRDKFLAEPGYNDAGQYGVKVVQSTSNTESVYWRLIGLHHLTPDENRGCHGLMVDVVDENGIRLNSVPVNWSWEGRRPDEPARPLVLDKPDNEVKDLVIWPNQTVSAWVTDNGDMIFGIKTTHPDEPDDSGDLGNSIGHHSFYAVWQRVPGGGPVPEPEPEPEPGQSDTRFDRLLAGLRNLISQAEQW